MSSFLEQHQLNLPGGKITQEAVLTASVQGSQGRILIGPAWFPCLSLTKHHSLVETWHDGQVLIDMFPYDQKIYYCKGEGWTEQLALPRPVGHQHMAAAVMKTWKATVVFRQI